MENVSVALLVPRSVYYTRILLYFRQLTKIRVFLETWCSPYQEEIISKFIVYSSVVFNLKNKFLISLFSAITDQLVLLDHVMW